MIRRYLTILAAVAALAALLAAPALAGDKGPVTSSDRQLMYDLMVSLEKAAGVAPYASVKILESSEEEFATMFSYIGDQESFYSSALKVMDDLKAGGANATQQGLTAGKFTTLATQPLGDDPFPPDYPPASGFYYSTIVQELIFYNLLPSTDANKTRCNSTGVADYYTVWVALYEAKAITDAICSFFGCDPTGGFCALACGPFEFYGGAVELAQRPLDLCGFHDANIDSAELQAGYENSVGIINSVNTHHTTIKASLDALHIKTDNLSGMVQTILDNQAIIISNQQTIITLLKTPQGRRPGWNFRSMTFFNGWRFR